MDQSRLFSLILGSSVSIARRLREIAAARWVGRSPASSTHSDPVARTSRDRSGRGLIRPARLIATGLYLALFLFGVQGRAQIVSHTIQISSDADDGYQDGNGWHSTPQNGGADLVGSSSDTTEAWVTGYRFPSTGINSGETIRSAYLQLVSSDGLASSNTCGSAPCANTNYTFRIYGVAEDDGSPFSDSAGNTPLDVTYTTSYVDYTSTGPGDVHGGCQGNNNGQNTCTHVIDVTNIVREITSRPGWTNASAMRFVMLSTTPSTHNVFAGYEDFSANPAKAATLSVNPTLPAIVSSGAWGTSPTLTYPTSYATGPFVYPGASTLLLFLGDYYEFYSHAVSQPTVSDSCGNTWNILAGPTDLQSIAYFMRATVYYVQNPVSCPAGDTITVTPPATPNGEPIFLHFLALAGSNTAQTPLVSAITSSPSGVYTTSATTGSVTLGSAGQLVSWIFGDSDSPHTFTPQAGFLTDVNSTPTYLTAATETVSSGSYTNAFTISPSDGWETVLIGLPAMAGTTATPTVTVTASPTSIGPSQDLTVTVSVSGSPTPTGSVVLSSSGYTSTATTLSGGTATIIVPAGSLTTGTNSLTASYTPDSTSSSIYSGATGTTSVNVAQITPTITVVPSVPSLTTSEGLSVTVSVDGGSGNPAATGSITLSGGGYTSTTTLSGGSATFNIAAGALTAGNDTLTASYAPDSGSLSIYSSATGAASVTVADPAAVTSPAPGSTLTSPSTTFSWSAGAGGITNYFLWIGSTIGGNDLANLGYLPGTTSATVNLPTTGATIYVRLWSYIGSTGFFNDYTYTEYTKGAPTVTVTPSLSTITTTQALSVTVIVGSRAGNPTPTGSVTLSGGSYTSAATAVTSGVAIINIPDGTLSAGSYTFKATYTPDANSSLIYTSSSGTASTAVVVGLATPAVTVTPSSNSITTNQALSVTVAVSGGTGSPTANGSVVLSSGSYTSPPATLSGGTATINIPGGTLSMGSYSFKASYTPDATSSSTYASASGTSSAVGVGLLNPTVTVTPGASSINITQPLSVTVMVSGGNGNPAVTGSVTLSSGNYSSAAATLTSGVAIINIPAGALSAGSYTFKAAYTPDTNSSSTYASASGTAATVVTVSLISPAVTVTPGVFSLAITQPLSVMVTVGAGAGNPTPTGTVVLSGGSYTSTATALNSGTATINIAANTLSVGSYTFKATYTPDAASSSVYAIASGTASSAVNVSAASFTMSATGATVAPGGSITSNVTASSNNGYAGTITLTCSVAGPTGAIDPPTCSGGQVTLSSTTTSAMATVTISTTAASASLVRPTLGKGRGWAGGSGAVLAVLIVLWVPKRQRTWRALLMVFGALLLLGNLAACGGSGGNSSHQSNSGTTAGNYTITITGTGNDASKTITTTTFTLTVS